MARVFEGRHVELGMRVALKLVEPTFATHPVATPRFLREAKAASQIRHQNVVEVFDIGTHEGTPFLVMEFLDGANLATLLAQRGALPVAGLAGVFLPIVSAVAAAHRAGIIHRDLKPANVVLTERPPFGLQPVVLDFGISKILDESDDDRTLTRSESLLGTVPYMAPELTKGAMFASPASDQYALGAMLYECATGSRPFTGDSYYDLMHAIITEPITPPSEIEPSLPAEFDDLVLRAMAREPEARFPSVHALGRALLPFSDKTAWAIWQREFWGEPDEERHPWSTAAGTLADDGAPKPLVVTKRPMRLHRRSTTRWLIGALAAYAAGASFLLARARSQHGGPPAAISIVTPTTAGHADPMPRAVEPVPTSASAITLTTVDTVPAPPVRDLPIAAPDRRTVPSKGGASKTARAQPSASAAVPAGVSGTNGALIFE